MYIIMNVMSIWRSGRAARTFATSSRCSDTPNPRPRKSIAVAIRKPQQIHATTHPGAELERKKSAVMNDDNRQGDEAQKAALLAALESESEEEE